MRYVFALLFAACCGIAGAQSAPPDPALADSIFRLIQTRSAHRVGADWAAIKAGFRARADTARTLQSQLSAFRYVFAQLNDVHSGLAVPGAYISHYVPGTAAEYARIRPLLERARQVTNQPQVRRLTERVGYVLVPAYQTMNPAQINAYTQALHDSLCRAMAPAPTGWVIDLRLNTGGNLYPMLSGLSVLLGDGPVGSQTDAQGRQMLPWAIRNGVFHLGNYATTTFERHCQVPSVRPKLAVLLSPITMSSGEAVAVALKGHPETRSFGQATAKGYTTGNQWYQLTPQVGLNLAEGFFTDRTGTVYKTRVWPDETLPTNDNFANLTADATVQAALRWLNSRTR